MTRIESVQTMKVMAQSEFAAALTDTLHHKGDEQIRRSRYYRFLRTVMARGLA